MGDLCICEQRDKTVWWTDFRTAQFEIISAIASIDQYLDYPV